jgi:hypothetical protein
MSAPLLEQAWLKSSFTWGLLPLLMGDLNVVTWEYLLGVSSSHIVFLVVCDLSTFVIDQNLSSSSPSNVHVWCGVWFGWLVVFICLGWGPWVKGWSFHGVGFAICRWCVHVVWMGFQGSFWCGSGCPHIGQLRSWWGSVSLILCWLRLVWGLSSG